jgi:predicted adenylyl cyclase CyaB
MANEVEVKFRVSSEKTKEVMELVTPKNYVPKSISQMDVYFETGSKTSLRIRYEEHKAKCITIKGPTKNVDGIKTREEIETSIEYDSQGSEKWTRAFELLGFKKSVTVSKSRTAVNYNGFEIAFDNVRDVGLFIEIEAKSEF